MDKMIRNPNRATINVMIVDDHDLVRTGLRHILDDVQGIKVVAEASDGEEAVKIAREVNPHVVLMDLKMPGIGGLGATRKLIKFIPDVKILIVTVCDDNLFPSKLLQAGAAGYLTKGASTSEMVQAIRSVSVGQRYISPNIAQQLVLKRLTSTESSPFEELSERELQVAMMIVTAKTVTEISDNLHLSPKTVNSYRYRIFEKMQVKSDVELTLLAMKHGIIEV